MQMHAKIVLSEDPLDYAALYAEIADAYFELEMYSEAGPIYETLAADPAVRHALCYLLIFSQWPCRQAVCIFFCKSPHAVECKVTYAKHLKFTNKVYMFLIPSHRQAANSISSHRCGPLKHRCQDETCRTL